MYTCRFCAVLTPLVWDERFWSTRSENEWEIRSREKIGASMWRSEILQPKLPELIKCKSEKEAPERASEKSRTAFLRNSVRITNKDHYRRRLCYSTNWISFKTVEDIIINRSKRTYLVKKHSGNQMLIEAYAFIYLPSGCVPAEVAECILEPIVDFVQRELFVWRLDNWLWTFE